ncbi:MAG: hypothetical protein V8Q43_02140 [Christensenellaceae bacterium]
MSDLLDAVPADGELSLPADRDNVTDLLDNLIADGKIPLTVAVFLTPGYPGPGEPVYGTGKGITNRSMEYDTVSDWFPRFLAEESCRRRSRDTRLPRTRRAQRRRVELERHRLVCSGVVRQPPVWQCHRGQPQLWQHPRRQHLAVDHPDDG